MASRVFRVRGEGILFDAQDLSGRVVIDFVIDYAWVLAVNLDWSTATLLLEFDVAGLTLLCGFLLLILPVFCLFE